MAAYSSCDAVDGRLPAVHQDVFPFSVRELHSGGGHPGMGIFAATCDKFPVLGTYIVTWVVLCSTWRPISLASFTPFCQLGTWEVVEAEASGQREIGSMNRSELSSPLTWNDHQKDNQWISTFSHWYICEFTCYNSCNHLFSDSGITTVILITEADQRYKRLATSWKLWQASHTAILNF